MTPLYVLVEACVTSVEEAVAASSAGAGRVELCRDLTLGGLTPERSLVTAVRAAIGIPVFVMVRPRAGSFVHGPDELVQMERDVRESVDDGADGIVMGVLRPDATVARDAMERLVRAAGSVPVTFHRAFDQIADLETALDAAIEVGARRVLTGGGPGRAVEQRDRLAGLVRRAGDRVGILAAGGVRADHVVDLVARTGAREVHARASAVDGLVRALAAGT